jgi:hypothetical protein
VPGLSLTLRSPGLVRLRRRMAEAPAVVEREMRLGLERSLAWQAEETRRRTPVKTGKLQHSINWRISGEFPLLTGEVFSAVPYARPVEKGTRPHVIKARRGQFLRFQIGERTIFARQVQHPGTKPVGMFKEAAAASRRQTRRFLAARLGNITRFLKR